MEALDLALLGGGLAVVAGRVVERTDVELDRVRRGGSDRGTGTSFYSGASPPQGGGPGTRSPRNGHKLLTVPEGAQIVLGKDKRVYTAQCYNCG